MALTSRSANTTASTILCKRFFNITDERRKQCLDLHFFDSRENIYRQPLLSCIKLLDLTNKDPLDELGKSKERKSMDHKNCFQ